MKKKLTILILFACAAFMANAQQDTAKKEEFKPSGKLWGYVFGDYAAKLHADSVPSGGVVPGGNTPRKLTGQNQYSSIPQPNWNAFNLRRVYLGYDYNISEKFSASVLLAHESGAESNITTDPSLTSDSKRAFYIKAANVKWKNIFPRADLVVGQQATPTFTTMSEKIWGYRSIEKTITDMRSYLTSAGSTDL